MERRGRAILGAVLTFGVCASVASGAGKVERPTYDVEPADCVTSKCHADVKAYPVLHSPVIMNTCDACHKPTGTKAHTFELTRQKADLCTYCHEFDTGMLPVVHKPVLTGECLGCHNPHGGTSHSLVREATSAALCGRCHESVALGRKFLHHPVETGECDTCHRPHASRYPKLLDTVGTDLCLSCHREFEAELTRMKFTHKALDEGCARCHDVHGSAYPMAVKQSVPDLCLSCHESVKDSTTAAYKHPAVLGDRACLTCHTAHGSNLARLMSDLPVRICMNCHDKAIEMKGGGVVAAVADVNDPTTFKHAPIRDGQCGGCHSTHGGDRPLLLRRAFPTEFYQRFSPEKYDLCFGCHDEQLAASEPARGLTNFRNGDRNLHFVHVNGSEQGRSCRACHGTHTGKYEQLIRDWVPFGKWRLPVVFSKTPTGGTCVTGCHPAFAYDRENPVASQEGGRQRTEDRGQKTESGAVLRPPVATPHVPAADSREPITAQWSTRDLSGAEVKVPVEGRPSVLLFLRVDQAQSQQVLKMVSAATPQIDLAQVVVIFSGAQAQEHAEAFRATKTVSWSIMADAEYALSKPLGVAVWPAVLVVQEDGVVVAHRGGAPLSLTVELQAYLDLAMKKIDRETLGTRLAAVGNDLPVRANRSSPLPNDGSGPRVDWLLPMSRELREQGQAQEALALLADGLKLQPDSIPLQVERIRALADLKQARLVLDLLKQLPAGALPAWEPELLRGRMLAALGQWDEARRLATAVLAGAKSDAPFLSPAHNLMGAIYEHDRDWEKAAQEYRAAHAPAATPAPTGG
ncbi:MAG: cytochrome c3 family protein [Planctomycetes bacterium]|nr:cytochrome c3 family protein [Planctomycetota bacterium]